jgi:hypothetical protein
MTRVIDHGDVEAVSDLPLNSVLLCRVDEVFQCKPVETEFGAGRAWYALGYGDRVWSAQEVAEWGPLRVLYRSDEDVPEGIMFCGWCKGTGLEEPFSDPPGQPCRHCRGLGYWDVELQEPISLQDALARIVSPAVGGSES